MEGVGDLVMWVAGLQAGSRADPRDWISYTTTNDTGAKEFGHRGLCLVYYNKASL